MVSLASLWLPIIVASVGVFIASSLVHMVIKWHNADYFGFSNEDDVRAAVAKTAPKPGQYVVPYCSDMKQMQEPAMQKKLAEGPVAFVFVRPNGMTPMGLLLGQWFALCVVISVAIGWLCSVTAPLGAAGTVRGVAAMAAFFAYGAGWAIAAIWDGRTWASALKHIADAAIYAAVTAASFSLLWPHA